MKKIIVLSLIAAMSLPTVTAFAAPIPRESLPEGAEENAVLVTENLIGGILDDVILGEGYGTASARANNITRKAVNAGETDGYGYGMLSSISQNAIRYTRDRCLRADYYAQLEIELTPLLADLIDAVKNGMNYNTALDEAYTRIYRKADPSYNPETDKSGDFCYWNVPAVDYTELAVARKLLLEVH